MGTEVEHGNIQTTVTAPPPTASTSTPKTSMFRKKLGFVIPKNKLSGSLVPVHRGPKKGEADLINEKATKQVQRKTKWGPDLTTDTTVRKGRASAYQTRINQIAQQLTLGVLELEDNEDSFATSESHSGKTSDHQLSHEESELLELERREIIGELLKLNPTYKAPNDYKPLLKEAKVPIPIKEYPGYNFIGLIFGHSSDTQKRLEKETGAKIQVYGTKADTGGKVEISPTDGKEIDNATYKDMYVYVSAETFEKVDAAVALIELLVTPVSVNPVSSSTTSTVSDNNVNTNPSQSTPNSIITPSLISQGPSQPYAGPLPLHQGTFPQYPQAWFSSGPTQAATYPNASGPLIGNTVQVSSSPFNLANMPSLFGPRPVIPASFSPVLQNTQPPQLVQSGGPRNTTFPILQSPTAQPSVAGPPYNARPTISISPQFAPVSISHGHNTMGSQNNVSGGPPVNMPNNFSPLSGPSQASGPSTMRPVQPAMPQVMRPNAALGPTPVHYQMQSSAPLLQPGIPNSFSGNAPNFEITRPVSAAIPRPQQPSSGDFTFLPHHPPNAASQAWQGNQAVQHNVRHPVQTGQTPLLRPMVHNLNPSPGQSFLRPQVSHQFNQPRANFSGSPTGPPRHHPILPGPTGPHMQPRNFIPPHPINNSLGPFPPRPGSQMHIQGGPQRFPNPNQHFANHPGRPFFSSSGVQQTYDPFSPSARVPSENDPEYEDLMASVGVK